jgi:hypothetical protein
MLLLITACASHYESDRNDPNYQKGLSYPVPLAAESTGPETAAVGLAAAGIALAANRDYYKSTAITGLVFCRSATAETIEIPCSNAQVMLADSKGHQLTSVQTNRGEFAFRVEKSRPYRLKVSAPGYVPAAPLPKEAYLGDDLVIHLKRSRSSP